jgi:hypothetical protein
MEFITNHIEIIVVPIICTGFSYILYSLVSSNKEKAIQMASEVKQTVILQAANHKTALAELLGYAQTYNEIANRCNTVSIEQLYW